MYVFGIFSAIYSCFLELTVEKKLALSKCSGSKFHPEGPEVPLKIQQLTDFTIHTNGRN